MYEMVKLMIMSQLSSFNNLQGNGSPQYDSMKDLLRHKQTYLKFT